MRYLWDQYNLYRDGSERLRQWDVTGAWVDTFTPLPHGQAEDLYLWVGEFVHYKRHDIAVEAFTRTGRKLVVIGGPESERKKLAHKDGPNVVFLGKTDFATLRDRMARYRALIFPGEEDFGLGPVKVMASGRLRNAYGRGGRILRGAEAAASRPARSRRPCSHLRRGGAFPGQNLRRPGQVGHGPPRVLRLRPRDDGFRGRSEFCMEYE